MNDLNSLFNDSGLDDAALDALARAGAWLGSLPARYALEQEDAVRAVSQSCGYSPEAVERAFRARFWTEKSPRLDPKQEPERTSPDRSLA